MSLLLKWLVGAAALMIVDYFLVGVQVGTLYQALIVVVVLVFLNWTIKPIITLVTLPINIITLGLFTFVINAAIFWFASSFLDGLAVSGFISALLGSLLYSIITYVGNDMVDRYL